MGNMLIRRTHRRLRVIRKREVITRTGIHQAIEICEKKSGEKAGVMIKHVDTRKNAGVTCWWRGWELKNVKILWIGMEISLKCETVVAKCDRGVHWSGIDTRSKRSHTLVWTRQRRHKDGCSDWGGNGNIVTDLWNVRSTFISSHFQANQANASKAKRCGVAWSTEFNV